MKRKIKIVAIPLAVCLLLTGGVMSFVAFGRKNAQGNRQSQYDALRDLAQEQKATLQAEMNGLFQVMRTLAAAMPLQGEDQGRIESLLARVEEDSPFTHVGFVDGQGRLYPGDAQMPEGLTRSEEPQVYWSRQDEESLFLFSAPTETGGVVFAYYPQERFTDLLATYALGESSYAFIAKSDGQIILPSNHPSYTSFSNNTLDFYREVVMENGASVEQVAQDLSQGRSGMLSYMYGNQYRYVVYQSVGVNDWFLFSAVDGNQVDAQANWSGQLLVRLAVELAAIAVLVGLLVILRDRWRQGEMKSLEQRLEESREIRRLAEGMSYTILFEADPQTGAIQYNDAFERQLGRKSQVTNYNDLLKEENPMPLSDAQTWRRLAQQMQRGLPKAQESVQLTHSNGEKIWYRVSFQTVYSQDKSQPVRIVGRFANIERQEREQDRNLAQAERDELTGLMGHMAFMQRAGKRLSRGDACALLIADIDGFKGARDMDGRYQGDQMLVRMSEVMRQVFHREDLLGRLGGDTFAVLMAGAAEPQEVAQRAQALCEAFQDADGHTCSVGIALSGKDVKDMSQLSHRADKALYRAKLAGKQRFEFYEGMVAEQLPVRAQGDDATRVVNRCAVALLTSEALAVGMDEALREVAQYYRASRACVMQADMQARELWESYCWCAPGCEASDSRRLPLSEGSLLMRAMLERHTLSIPQINEKTVGDPETLRVLRERHTSALYMAPMGKRGFLAIENPQDHVGGATVLKQVAACVAGALGKGAK